MVNDGAQGTGTLLVQDDITVRLATIDDRYALARIILDATYSAFRGVAPDASVESLTVEESAANWARTIGENEDPVILVAEVGGIDVIGLAMAGTVRTDRLTVTRVPANVDSELYSLHVDPA